MCSSKGSYVPKGDVDDSQTKQANKAFLTGYRKKLCVLPFIKEKLVAWLVLLFEPSS